MAIFIAVLGLTLIYLFPPNRELYPKIDVNKDKKVSMDELYEWIEQHMRKHVLHGADMKMRDMDTNKDGKVSWEEFKEVEFHPSIEEG